MLFSPFVRSLQYPNMIIDFLTNTTLTWSTSFTENGLDFFSNVNDTNNSACLEYGLNKYLTN